MSYGINSFGVGSLGAPAVVAGGLIVDCLFGSASAVGYDVDISTTSGLTVTCTFGEAAAVGYDATISMVPTVDIKIGGIGQSNMSGRAYNSQPAPADGAWLYTNDGRYIKLVDPWDAGPNTYSVLDEGASPDGSYIPAMAQHYADSGRTTLWIPAAKGSTTVTAWQRNLSTTQLYGAAKARIDAAGGVDKLIIHLGESDAVNGTSQATFVSLMNQLITDLIADFGCEVYLQKIHTFSGYAAGCATIRAAIEEVWNGTSGVKRGADVDGLTTDVHFLTDTEIDTVGDLTYAALEGLNISASFGAASAVGYDAIVSSGLVVSAEFGAASGVGYQADVSLALSISLSFGEASAVGYLANVSRPLNINTIFGGGQAVGYEAYVSNDSTLTINAIFGAASAVGFDVSIATGAGTTLTQADLDAISALIDIEAIAAAVIVAIRSAAPLIPVDAQQMNGATIFGTGVSSDKWRGNA